MKNVIADTLFVLTSRCTCAQIFNRPERITSSLSRSLSPADCIPKYTGRPRSRDRLLRVKPKVDTRKSATWRIIATTESKSATCAVG